MREKEQFDAAFQEVTRNKAGITEKIRKVSRDPDVLYISSGALLECLGGGMYYLGLSVHPIFFLPALSTTFAGVPLLTIPGTNKLLDNMFGVAENNRDEAYKRATKVFMVYESKQKDPPSKEQIEALLKKIFYLPPVGHKVTLEKNSLNPTVLFPSLTADEKVEEIIRFRQKGFLDETYVHQLTIQGRMSDEFKYAALALIINSTYRSDWSKPFYEADWAKVAPLIHGGGRLNHINPLWYSRGRTDFLQRVATVYKPELENMEQYATPQLATQFSSEDLASAVLEQEERSRLILEMYFYQRAAFALHAKIGTLPNAVPRDIARKGMQEWENFVKGMDNILNSYDASKITKPRWFTRVPHLRAWGGGILRYESNYSPIQQALMSLEEIKSKNPSLRQEVNALMSKTVSSIDNAIGIQNLVQ